MPGARSILRPYCHRCDERSNPYHLHVAIRRGHLKVLTAWTEKPQSFQQTARQVYWQYSPATLHKVVIPVSSGAEHLAHCRTDLIETEVQGFEM